MFRFVFGACCAAKLYTKSILKMKACPHFLRKLGEGFVARSVASSVLCFIATSIERTRQSAIVKRVVARVFAVAL